MAPLEFCIGNGSPHHLGPGCTYLVPMSWKLANRTLFPSCKTSRIVTPPLGQMPSLGYAGNLVTQGGRVHLSSQNSRAPGLFPASPRPGTRGAGGRGGPRSGTSISEQTTASFPAQMKPFLSQVTHSLISGCVCG